MNPIQSLVQEQNDCLSDARDGMSMNEIARKRGLSRDQVKRRLAGARKRKALDPVLADKLASKGIVDLAGLHSGWLIDKNSSGSGESLYFYLGPDQEKISFADAMIDALGDIPRLGQIEAPDARQRGEAAEDLANWMAIADLHVGGDYGDALLEEHFIETIDDLIARLPKAKHAVLFELGDLLEANDHKGMTPTSGNLLDVRREDHLKNTMTAIRLIRYALIRLLETHETVEAHFIKGNHDPTAYMAVMLALSAHFEMNPRIKIHVKDEEFRVISWGECAAFPHHGDTLKWEQLKDVFADQFPDEWAAAKTHRIIMTAHFHHDRSRDLVGCVAEHYRTLHRPNKWAKSKGLFSRGSLTVMTVHKTKGERTRTSSSIVNNKHGK